MIKLQGIKQYLEKIKKMIGSEISEKNARIVRPTPVVHEEKNTAPTIQLQMSSEKNDATVNEISKKEWVLPENYEEFMEIVEKIPEKVLNKKDKFRIFGILAVTDTRVRDLMTPYKEVINVKKEDLLGPIMLDKIYKTGLTKFPVVNEEKQVIGLASIRELNGMELKEDILVKNIMTDKVFYVNENYNFLQFLSAVVRTGADYFLVCNKFQRITGVIGLREVLELIFWQNFDDEFESDANISEVSKRV